METQQTVKLDLSTLVQLREASQDNQPQLISNLVDLFEENAKEVAKGLRALDYKADAVGIARLAHRLKGSSGMLGAHGLADICRKIEDREKEGQMSAEAYQRILADLDTEVEAVLKALRDFAGQTTH